MLTYQEKDNTTEKMIKVSSGDCPPHMAWNSQALLLKKPFPAFLCHWMVLVCLALMQVCLTELPLLNKRSIDWEFVGNRQHINDLRKVPGLEIKKWCLRRTGVCPAPIKSLQSQTTASLLQADPPPKKKPDFSYGDFIKLHLGWGCL